MEESEPSPKEYEVHELENIFGHETPPRETQEDTPIAPLSILRVLQALASKTTSESKIILLRFFSRHISSGEDSIPLQQISHRLVLSVCTVVARILPRFLIRNGLYHTKKKNATAYLDALRGWAAVVVVNHHMRGYIPIDSWWIARQPIYPLFVAGSGAVDVFFVISGYALSHRLLRLAHTQQAVPLLNAISSSVFRRFWRLYGSAAFASFISMIVVALGLYAPNPPLPLFTSQLWDWAKEFIRFSNIFENIPGVWYPGVFNNKYLEILWTIPVEFRASMVVFAFCIASCKLSNRSRILLCSCIILHTFLTATTYLSCFLGGVLIADQSLTRHPERHFPMILLPINNESTGSVPLHYSLYKKAFYWIMLLIALLLVGQPERNQPQAFRPWPWPFLDTLVPSFYRDWLRPHFWLSIGAIILLFSLDSYPRLQVPLLWNFSQYLGDISFGIYVMHVPMLRTVYEHIANPLRQSLLGESIWGYVLCLLCFYPMVFWAAEWFAKVDDSVVASGRWLQTRLFIY